MVARKSSTDAWTRELSRQEAMRRWGVDCFEIVTWRERFPRPGGKMATKDRDLLGLADGLAFPADGGTVALQWTDRTSVAAHITKAMAEPRLAKIARAGWQLLIWGWDVMGSTPRLREVVVLDGSGEVRLPKA